MAKWPLERGNPNITMDNARAAGTMDYSGSRAQSIQVKFTATAYWGLIKTSYSAESGASYRIVQLWYKMLPSTFPLYKPVTTEYGGQHGVGARHCVGKNGKKSWSRADEPANPLSLHEMFVDGKPLSSYNDLFCENSLLYKAVQIARRYPAADRSVMYYRHSAGRYSVYNSGYDKRAQNAAMGWKLASGPTNSPLLRDGSDLPFGNIPDIFTTGTNPAETAALGDELFAAAQADLDAHPDWKAARNLIHNRLPNGMPNYAILRNLVQTVLSEKGWTQSQITAFLASKGVKISTGTPNRGGSQPTGISPPKPVIVPTPAVTKVVVRAPYGFAKPAAKAPDNRPQLIQNYTTYVKDSSVDGGVKAVNGQDIFVFPYTPNNVSYSGLGSKWDSIDREGNYPIVEWSSWDLMRCEMEFLVAEQRTEGTTQVPDGLFVSVQDRLNTLRRMSQRQATVSVFNLDDLFRIQVKRAKETGKALQFVIADLSFTSTRRSVDSVEKEITAASVKLTLQEIPMEKVSIVKMSPPTMSRPVVPRRTPPDQEPEPDPLFVWGLVEGIE